MDEKQYAVLLTETQDVKVIACNPDKDIFDIGREAIGCDWIELVEAEPLAKDGLLMMIDEEGKLKPGGALINATASALYGTERHGDPIMGNAVIVRTTGENLELLTSGEAEQLAVRMEAVRDSALQKIAEAFARRPTSKQERSTSSLPRRQPCRKDQFGEIIWMEKEKRLIKHTFKTTEAEAETIRRKMKSLGIRNESAYMRAMALNGYILKLDLPQIREMLRLLRNMTNNLNQISKRLNVHGQMYETEIEEVQQKQNELWVMMRQLLSLLDRSE